MKDTKWLRFIIHEEKEPIKDEGVLVVTYSDADYVVDKTDWKSVSGGVTIAVWVVAG